MLRVQVGIVACDNAIIMRYFSKYPKYLHRTKFALSKVIYFCLIIAKVKTRPRIFITKINIKILKKIFSGSRVITSEKLTEKFLRYIHIVIFVIKAPKIKFVLLHPR